MNRPRLRRLGPGVCETLIPLALALAAISGDYAQGASPRPDPAPGARGPVVILPSCSYVPGVPASYWITGVDARGNVVCIGPNRRTRATLVTPAGRPVGGEMQRWVDQAHVPTYPGRVVFSTDVARICGAASLGCMLPPTCDLPLPPDFVACPWRGWTPEVVVAPGDRWTLEHELGHVFDYRYLTPALRRHLVPLLGERGHPWFINEDAMDAFANTYAYCAETANLTRDGWPSYGAEATTAADLIATCRLIKRVAP